MINHPDHFTVVVRDPTAAIAFFGLLGFRLEIDAVIRGEPFATYMGVDQIEAEHRTLVLAGVEPRFEIQLLTYRHPAALDAPDIATLRAVGFNHVCFRVDDLDAEIRRLTAHGVRLRNRVMDYHDARLVFLDGPEGITVELAERH
jgi:catechol 2,3-dioxygenase-like lactoylglutathione lyase family enzyme